MKATLLAAVTALCSTSQQGSAPMVSAFDPLGDNAYASWNARNKNPYEQSYLLPSHNEDDDDIAIALHWTIDSADNLLRLAVAAETTGWLGFGLAEVGGMLGADIAVFTASDGTLTDFYSTAYDRPQEDSCQDWTLVDSSTEGGFIIWEATRKLDTGDTQDRVLIDDSDHEATRIIAAYGDSDNLAFHGKNVFKANMRFFGDGGEAVESFLRDMTAEGTSTREIRAGQYNMPSARTTYKWFCMTASEMGIDITKKHHAIGFLPIVEYPQFVHHMDIHASEQDSCNDGGEGGDFFNGWAKGQPPRELPLAAGYPIGAGGYKSFRLQVHYDNPEGKEGVVDSSGFRIYFSNELRQHDAGYMRVGDALVTLFGQSIPSGLSKHVFDCLPTRSQNQMNADEVTVFIESLHQHEFGLRMSNQIIRHGGVVHEAVADYWDFAQAGSLKVQQPSFLLQRGDAIRTTCYYNTTGTTKFGISSGDEMCINYMIYYPKEAIPGNMCIYSKDSSELSYHVETIDEAGLEREFGVDSDHCAATTLTSTKLMRLSMKVSQKSPLFLALVFVAVANAAIIAFIIIFRCNNQKVRYSRLAAA